MTNTMAYVAKKSCGCTVAAIEDHPSIHRRDIANEVRSWILDGLIVERTPSEQVRISWGLCPHQEHQLDLFSEENHDG